MYSAFLIQALDSAYIILVYTVSLRGRTGSHGEPGTGLHEIVPEQGLADIIRIANT